MPPAKPLKVLVTGPTGTTGREVVKVLLDRGHHVTGLSRRPEGWGVHPRYTPRKGTQMEDIDALVDAVEGHDVVVSAFAPSHAAGQTTYIGLVEGAWRIKEAVKRCSSGKKPYLLYVGGAGSLIDPVTGKITLDDSQRTWTTYLIEGPIQHHAWLSTVLKIPAFTAYYYVRDYAHSNALFSPLFRLFTRFFERKIIAMQDGVENLTMPHACRAAVSFFEHDETFDWTFLSPPWFYREGKATGVYGTVEALHPADAEGRWLGINSGDIAVAIADEIEEKKKNWIHWSCFARQEETKDFYDDYAGVKFTRFENARKI